MDYPVFTICDPGEIFFEPAGVQDLCGDSPGNQASASGNFYAVVPAIPAPVALPASNHYPLLS
jgi:hypothetical protein